LESAGAVSTSVDPDVEDLEGRGSVLASLRPHGGEGSDSDGEGTTVAPSRPRNGAESGQGRPRGPSPDEYEQRKELEEIYKSLADVETLNQVNAKFGQIAATDQANEHPHLRPIVTVDRQHFMKFFELKRSIKEEQLEKEKAKQELEALYKQKAANPFGSLMT